MKFGEFVGRGAAAIACTLMLTVSAGMAAHAEDVPSPIVETTPSVEPAPSETLPEETPVQPPPEETPVDPLPEGPLDPGPVVPLPEEPPKPLPEQPAQQPVPSVPKPPSTSGTSTAPAPVLAPLPASAPEPAPALQELIQELAPAAPVQESAAPSPATSTAPASKAPAPSKASAPLPLPEPVAKTIDSVVSVATGSPLHVQIITVFTLIAAGYLYFRFMGSKSRRSPVRSHK